MLRSTWIWDGGYVGQGMESGRWMVDGVLTRFVYFVAVILAFPLIGLALGIPWWVGTTSIERRSLGAVQRLRAVEPRPIAPNSPVDAFPYSSQPLSFSSTHLDTHLDHSHGGSAPQASNGEVSARCRGYVRSMPPPVGCKCGWKAQGEKMGCRARGL
jgi:hypothetical protein